MTEERLSPSDYQSAIFAQDACNLSGIVISFAEVTRKVWGEANALGKGTDWVNTHPICVLYANKIGSLARSENIDAYSKAYDICKAESEKCA